MILGVQALIRRESDLEFLDHSNNHQTLIDEIRTHQPDVLIIDLSLYSQESFDFLRRIRETFPNLKIVVLSVHTKPVFANRAIEAGADAYVAKTEDPSRIIDAVRAVRTGENYISERIRGESKDSAAPIDSPINLLTKQEFRILQRIGKGKTNRQIAEELQLPMNVIEEETSTIQQKLDLSSPIELLQFAFHWVHHEGGFS